MICPVMLLYEKFKIVRELLFIIESMMFFTPKFPRLFFSTFNFYNLLNLFKSSTDFKRRELFKPNRLSDKSISVTVFGRDNMITSEFVSSKLHFYIETYSRC